MRRLTLLATVALIAGAIGYAQTLPRTVRVDVNGEPLSYNAPCSTDTDCALRFPSVDE